MREPCVKRFTGTHMFAVYQLVHAPNTYLNINRVSVALLCQPRSVLVYIFDSSWPTIHVYLDGERRTANVHV